MPTPLNQQPAHKRFLRGFIDHPASVNETYLQHARFAVGFSATLLLAAGAALIHAVAPPLFERQAVVCLFFCVFFSSICRQILCLFSGFLDFFFKWMAMR